MKALVVGLIALSTLAFAGCEIEGTWADNKGRVVKVQTPEGARVLIFNKEGVVVSDVLHKNADPTPSKMVVSETRSSSTRVVEEKEESNDDEHPIAVSRRIYGEQRRRAVHSRRFEDSEERPRFRIRERQIRVYADRPARSYDPRCGNRC